MTAPIRLRLSRAKGFDLQAHSIATNGLAAMSVSRPGKWGNPYRVDPPEHAVELYRSHIDDCMAGAPARRALLEALRDLRGKNLACWCAPGAPCHADVLLGLANSRVACEAAP